MSINQKRLEYQLYLARENPEPIYDVSKCGLLKVPQGCYALCKVLRKKKLSINDNKISELTSNGNLIEDLTVLTHINAQYNEITKLPEDINAIQYLQILDVSHNQLKHLPSSMGGLLYLRKLYLQHNNLSQIPESMLTEQCALELIDISENINFSSLPGHILNLRKLKAFSYTTKYLQYPSQDVCQRGALEIVKVLCQDAGVMMTSSIVHRLTGDLESDDVDFHLVDSSALDYESFKQNRINFLSSVEQERHKSLSFQEDLRDKAMKDKSEFLNKIINEEVRITEEISILHMERELRREQLVSDVKVAEADAKNLIEEIMTVNKAFQQQDQVLDELERDSIKKYQVYQEEYSRLRKEEILGIMSQMLQSRDSTEELLRHQILEKEELQNKITRSKSEADESIHEFLKDRRKKQDSLFSEIERQERHQKLAFQHLQLLKDVRTLRIKEQILSVESELMILSQVEQNRRAKKNSFELSILSERRSDLVKLLRNLLEQKGVRERDLLKKLMEIERQRTDDQVDFWLVQYQRLLDMKPLDLQDQSSNLEGLVLETINRANAREYLPFVQRRNTTWEQLDHFQEKDLLNMGIHNKSKIRDILNAVAEIKEEREKKDRDLASSPKLSCESPPNAFTLLTNAPKVLSSHKETECCICFADETTILFLECGHICCCDKCSQNLKDCPLCRQSISRFIKLMVV